jgi:transcription antitermination factor NusG
MSTIGIASWFAIQTRLNIEKTVEMSLFTKGYETFLPTYKQIDRGPAGSSIREKPLFPGYLFCRILCAGGSKIVETPGVIRIVKFCGRPCEVPESQIEAIRTIVRTDTPRKPLQTLVCGATVRIEKGPLSGLQGVLMSDSDADWIVISIDLMGRSVAARIESGTPLSIIAGASGKPAIGSLPYRGSDPRSHPADSIILNNVTL